MHLHNRRWEKIDELFTLGIISSNVWLGGGSLQSLVNALIPVKDYDVFFQSKSLVQPVRDKLSAAGYTETFACPAGELFTYRMGEDATPIQLICKFYYPTMGALIDSFDFTATQWATDGNDVLTTKAAIRDSRKMQIKIHKVTYPVATMNRMFKYRDKKGFHLSGDTLIEFIKLVNSEEFDDENMALYVD